MYRHVPLGIAIGVLTASTAATAAPAETTVPAVPSALAATVAGRTVTHAGEKVAVRVPAAAAYVGAERFNLYGVADAEIHVFAEADSAKRVCKLYWIQFESYLPSIGQARYDYGESDRRSELWGATTWLSAGPSDTTQPVRAGSDREKVNAILKRSGYALPPEMMMLRMVQLLDDPKGTGYGRRELMVIYGEDLASTGQRVANLRTDGKVNAQWAPLEHALTERAAQAVTIERV